MQIANVAPITILSVHIPPMLRTRLQPDTVLNR